MAFKCLSTLATLLAVLQTPRAYDPDFTCLGDDATTIKFQNSEDLVPDLWQVRVMMGGYGSQYALNYAAYMFMREKLGMNVTWWPTSDHNTYWNYFITPYYGTLYWTWLKNDSMDVNFEFWTIQEENADAYSFYADGSIVSGFVGLFGEISLWMPKYFVEAHPTAIVPHVLKTNLTIRQLLIDGSISGGDTDWVAAYGVGGSHRTFNTSFDIPDGTRPVVWASNERYAQVGIAHGMINSSEMEMDVVGTSVGGEGNLFDLVFDLYSNRAPFIANIYVPDDNYAVVDNETARYQNFEKVAFPRNPNQANDDPCMVNRTCQYPVDPIKKASNIKLQARFPEAYQFYTAFALEASQLADVQRHYNIYNKKNPSDEEHTKWLNAACNWLQDPVSADAWNNTNWLVDVQRWQCLPGCGVSSKDDPDFYFGGTCNYEMENDVTGGTCECDYDELYGDLCDLSCPGLNGPYQMEDGGDWTFDFCSGHGTCDTTNYLCSCNKGFGGKGCQTKYDKYVFPVGLGGTIIAFSSLLALACISCIVWLRLNAHYKTVKALSIQLTTIFSFGLVMIACSNIALVTKVTDASCIAWQWLFGLGGILSIMSPMLKAYRVSRVFHGGKMLRAVKITDKMLMNNLVKAAGFEVLICVAYSIFHQVNGGTMLHYNDDELRTERQCNDDKITVFLSIASYAYFFIMLCSLTYYSYGTRRALSVFKESTCAYSSSFLSMFCTLITLAFYAATSDPTFRFTVQAVAIIIVVAAVIGLFYGTRIYRFFADVESRNVTDNRAPTYTSSSTTGPTNTNVMSSSSPAAATKV